MDVKKKIIDYADMVETALRQYIPSDDALYGDICKAAAYSLLDAGKRIRPVLTLEFCRACGGKIENAMPFACAVEMIHSYSLIHDDLPCLDNDDMRRGKPSSHIKFGEPMALLAGDGLQALAFETALNPENFKDLSCENGLRAAYELAKAAGITGMVGGQVIDIQSEGKKIDLEILQILDSGKTGAIIKAAAKMGCIVAGADEEKIKAAQKYAEHLGIAFQIVDDILDVTGDEKLLGKPINSDEQSDKSTYVSILGMEEAVRQSREHTEKAVAALAPFGREAEFLIELAKYLCQRNY